MWNTVLTTAELAARYALTASVDPAFAKREREWYEGRTNDQLRIAVVQAWNCNDASGYQMAKSYLAIRGA